MQATYHYKEWCGYWHSISWSTTSSQWAVTLSWQIGKENVQETVLSGLRRGYLGVQGINVRW